MTDYACVTCGATTRKGMLVMYQSGRSAIIAYCPEHMKIERDKYKAQGVFTQDAEKVKLN